jgi:hypothetical protein
MLHAKDQARVLRLIVCVCVCVCLCVCLCVCEVSLFYFACVCFMPVWSGVCSVGCGSR